MNKVLLPILLIFMGCGSMKKWALRSANPVFQKSSDLTTHERNWNYFREATPANLKLTELLYLQDPDNLELLALLIKGYAGYAYAVPDTLYFGDRLSGKEESEWRKHAIDHYTRAFDYGISYLREKGISVQDLLTLEESKLKKKLKDKLDEHDLLALVYTGQSWGSLINLQKDNIALISQVPRVKILFDRACKMKPDVEQGMCDFFYAQYEASRPRMLGGNPEKASELYGSALVKYPKNLLLQVNYLEQLILPAMEKDIYEKVAQTLKEEFVKWENFGRENLKDESTYKDAAHLNLYNAIAKKRFEFIEKNKDKIFE